MKKKILILVIPLMILSLVVGFAVRYTMALHKVRQSGQALSELSLVDIGSTVSFSIMPVFEAWSKSDMFPGGHGLSYLLKTDTATILLDLGNNEGRSDPSPLQMNMQTLGISFDDIDAVVLSHNHPDHVGGAYWWRRRSFSADNEQQVLAGMTVYLPEKMKHPQAGYRSCHHTDHNRAWRGQPGCSGLHRTVSTGLAGTAGLGTGTCNQCQRQGHCSGHGLWTPHP
ncbi:MAG: MBL fold metallo-hydrolase [Bacillota bacterium]|nr:MBL fold metallo-hydrolase [Bacillota bacterium]